MNTHKSLHAMLAALFLLAACDNPNGIDLPLEDQSFTVTADVVQHTKAGYESGVLLPEKFVVDVNQGAEDKYNYSLVEMTKDAGTNTYSAPAGTELLWAGNNTAPAVKAMTIPFGLTAVDPVNAMAVSVSLQQNNAANVAASDMLGATSATEGCITVSGTNINIEFQHLLSKLDVTYNFASEFNENTVAVNSMTLQNICTTGGYSYANMSLVASNLAYGDVAMYHTASTSTFEAIFYPYKPTENPTLLINATIDGVEYDFTCPVVAKDANGFVGGKRYTMTVTIVGSSVSGTDASIAKGWDTNTEDESFVTE